MIKQFFVMFDFRKKTYEIKYNLEVIRLILLVSIGIFLLLMPNVIFKLPLWTYIPIFLTFFCILLMFHCSWARLIAIYYNRKFSIRISIEQLYLIRNLYCQEKIFLMVNGKYIQLIPDVQYNIGEKDSIILIRIGNSYPYQKKKLKQILGNEKDNFQN